MFHPEVARDWTVVEVEEEWERKGWRRRRVRKERRVERRWERRRNVCWANERMGVSRGREGGREEEGELGSLGTNRELPRPQTSLYVSSDVVDEEFPKEEF